jgi:hypothetical protein
MTASATMMILIAGLHLVILFVAAGVFVDELPGDPEQQEPTCDLQERDLQQEGDDGREDEPQDDGTGGAPEDRLPALGALEPTGGHGDDHGVVAGENKVNSEHFDECEPINRLGQRLILLRPLPHVAGAAPTGSYLPRSHLTKYRPLLPPLLYRSSRATEW